VVFSRRGEIIGRLSAVRRLDFLCAHLAEFRYLQLPISLGLSFVRFEVILARKRPTAPAHPGHSDNIQR